MSDALNQVMSGVGTLGGQAAQGVKNVAGDIGTAFGGDPGKAAGDFGQQLLGAGQTVGHDVMDLGRTVGGDISHLLNPGAGGSAPAGVPSPTAQVNGTFSASNPATPAAGGGASVAPTGAAAAVSAVPGQISGEEAFPYGPGASAGSGGVLPQRMALPSEDPLAAHATATASGHPLMTATPGAGGAAPAAHGNDFLKSLMQPKNLLMGGLGGMSLINALKQDPMQKNLKREAWADQAKAKMLENEAQADKTGQIPEGLRVGLQQQTDQQIAQIRQKYAQMGMSGSTMEAQDIANAKQAGYAQAVQLGQQLAQQGLSQAAGYENSATGLLQAVMQDQMARDQELVSGLAEFASLAAQPGIPATTAAHG